jgi:sorbitol-specific phosphotransferase system component IIBC
MKAIIYAGIGLFSAATIYGVVDYYNTKNKGTIDKLYKEEIPVSGDKKETIQTQNAVELTKAKEESTFLNDNTTLKKNAEKKYKKSKPSIREVRFSDFSRGRIVPKVAEDTKTVVADKTEKK